MSKVFVTGASGFLGKHLMERLIENNHQITVLLRDVQHSNKQSLIQDWQQRVEKIKMAGGHPSVDVVEGDIVNVDLEKVDAKHQLLLSNYDHIYHLAAIYDLGAAKEKTLQCNVQGTENILNKMDEDSFSGCFHCVSSIAIAGNFKGEFSESMFEEGQRHEHIYNRSKFLSEKLVREKRENSPKYDVRIYRPSAIVGHSKTGEMDKIDGPYYGFVVVSGLKRIFPSWFPLVLPKNNALMDMVPVDYVADALYRISQLNKIDNDQFCFHLTDPNAPTITTAIKLLLKAADGPKITVTFNNTLTKMYPGLVSLAGNLQSVETIKNEVLGRFDIPSQVFDAMMEGAQFDAKQTIKLLAKQGVVLPAFSSYVDNLWDYFNRHLDPRRNKTSRYEKALRGKVVLITGGSSGIGLASAERAVTLGAKVILVARSLDKLELAYAALKPIADEHDASIEILPCDISDLDACDNLVKHLLGNYGNVDVFFNNAGRSIRRSISESLDRFHDLERTMQLNYFGAVRIIHGLLPSMVEHKSGHILNSSSMGTMSPTPRFSAYMASKSAMDAYTDSLAAEYLNHNIHVTSIKFPLVKTGMIAPTKDYDGVDVASPEFAATLFLDAVLNRPRKQILTQGVWMGLANLFTPKIMTHVYNFGYRIWPDERGQHMDLSLDRSLIKKIIPRSPL